MQARPLQESLRLCLGACAAISLTDDLVFKSIDESLAAVLGTIVRDAVYLRFLTKYSLTREQTPKHLDTFQTTMEDCFGPVAAKVLSRAIAKRLYSELHLTFIANPAYGLIEYVEEAKSKLLEMKPQTAEKTNAVITTCRENNGSPEKDCD